jgi:hypothetical protein
MICLDSVIRVEIDSTNNVAPSSLDPRAVKPEIFYSTCQGLGMSHEMARRWAGAVIGRGERLASQVMVNAKVA